VVTLCCGPRDARKSDVDAVFANIAEKSGVLDDTFTKEAFLADLHDWEKVSDQCNHHTFTPSSSRVDGAGPTRSIVHAQAVKPAYTEHKIALGYGVTFRCGNQCRVDSVLTRSSAQVYGTPTHVIDEKLVPDTESAWGAADWADKLKSL